MDKEQILRKAAKIKDTESRYNFRNHHLVTTRQALKAMDEVEKEALKISFNPVLSDSKNLCGWVSVNDDIPNSETVVLVCVVVMESPFMFRTLAYIDADGRWWKGVKQLHNVSHWQHLPELPNKASDGK